MGLTRGSTHWAPAQHLAGDACLASGARVLLEASLLHSQVSQELKTGFWTDTSAHAGANSLIQEAKCMITVIHFIICIYYIYF